MFTVHTKSFHKTLDPHIVIPAQHVYACSLEPGISCRKQVGALLVVMDAFRKFVTIYSIKKSSSSDSRDEAIL